MFGSALLYSGVIIALAGLLLVIKPIARLGARTRARALAVAGTGFLLAVSGLVVPAPESRISKAETRLDAFVPVWQFHERHTIRIAAPPDRVFDAIRHVRADEISLFQTLTWIRRGGQPLPQSILNAGGAKSLVDVATSSGFVRLADDAPHELVIGTVVIAPPGTRGALTPQVFKTQLPPGLPSRR